MISSSTGSKARKVGGSSGPGASRTGEKEVVSSVGVWGVGGAVKG